MKYILDFDSTLFDSKACYEHITEIRQGDFVYAPEVWEGINVGDFLYTDVLSWIGSKLKEDLFILTAITPSYGDKSSDFQKEKLRCSQLTDLVDKVVFMEGLKGDYVLEIAKQFPATEKIVFVDDRIEQCLSVKSVLPESLVCLMVRDKSVIGEVEEVQGIKVVHELKDVDGIIKNL